MAAKGYLGVAVRALILYQGRVLLLRRSKKERAAPGVWEFPGGKLEYGETPREALLREVQEEAGLNVQAGRVLYASSFRATPRSQFVIICSLCRAESDRVCLSEEHQDWLWATKSQMLQMLDPLTLQDLEQNAVLQQPDIELLDE